MANPFSRTNFFSEIVRFFLFACLDDSRSGWRGLQIVEPCLNRTRLEWAPSTPAIACVVVRGLDDFKKNIGFGTPVIPQIPAYDMKENASKPAVNSTYYAAEGRIDDNFRTQAGTTVFPNIINVAYIGKCPELAYSGILGKRVMCDKRCPTTERHSSLAINSIKNIVGTAMYWELSLALRTCVSLRCLQMTCSSPAWTVS